MSNHARLDPQTGQWIFTPIPEKSAKQLEREARQAEAQRAGIISSATKHEKRPEYKSRDQYLQSIMPGWSKERRQEFLEKNRSFGSQYVQRPKPTEQTDVLSDGWLAEQRAQIAANKAQAQALNETLNEANEANGDNGD